MPYGILKFKLPEEQEEFKLAQNGAHLSCVIDDLDQWLRNLAKHQDKVSVTIEEVRAKIRELNHGD